jgi:biopolymer transport protein ExbB/TolQ
MLTQKILSFSLIGGEWVLWLLLALSAVSLAVVVDRFLVFRRSRDDFDRLEPALIRSLAGCDYKGAHALVAGDGFVKNVIRAGLDALIQGRADPGSVEQAMMGAIARERNRLETRLTFLGTVGNNAPFIGLFGTVLGIILAFNQLARLDASQGASNQYVMGAISEALIATGVGIAVAIPAVVAYNWAKATIASRVKNAESLMRAVMAGSINFACMAAGAKAEKGA